MIRAEAPVARPPEPELTGLLTARLCHDLISPANAIGNGVELLREAPGGGDGAPELDLIGASASNLSATLQFLRAAFGAAQPGERQGLPALQRLARGWFAHQRATLDWPEATGETTRRAGRLTLNLLQCAASCLPRGGTVALRPTPEGGFAVTAEGPTLILPEAAEAWLAARPDAPAPEPRTLHWYLAGRHAREARSTVALTREGETTLRLEAAPPG